jgi:type IV secretion system protein VirB8
MSQFDHALLVDSASLAKHYKDVESFQAARARSAQRLSRFLIILSAIALFANLAQAWTIASMLPLTKIVPVYLWVRPDGTVDSSVSMSRLPATLNQAVIDASLWEYVRLREGYSYDTARYGYDIVSDYSAPNVREEYQRFFNYPNPESPQVTLGRRGTIEIDHISSSDIGTNLQQIRFTRIVTIEGGRPAVTTWTATLGYATVRDLPTGLRLTNPGGIIVTSYQAAEDSAP